MIDFIIRNAELFFRDRLAVTMSILAEIIVMLLYIIFMRDNLMSAFSNINESGKLLDAWMIAGILGIAPVTASMGAYGIMVGDKVNDTYKDFKISPLGDTRLLMGYIFSSAIVGIMISAMVLLMGEVYLYIRYGIVAGETHILKIYMISVINSLLCSIIILLPVSFLKSSNALAGCCTIFGALIGFLTGIYLPVGTVDENVAMIIKYFPVSHSTSVLRRLLTEKILETSIDPSIVNKEETMEYLGIIYLHEGNVLTGIESIVYMTVISLICFMIVLIKHKLSNVNLHHF